MSALSQNLARRARDLASAAAFEASTVAVSRARAVPVSDMRRKGSNARAHHIAQAKKEAVYLAVTAFGLPIRAIGRVSGLSAEMVSKACRAVEDARDDYAYDRALDVLHNEVLV
jgi:hypothetical protein